MSILKGVVGSTAHGLNLTTGDRDEMGIFVETMEQVMGLTSEDHRISRSKPVGVRSEPGDLDLTEYSLRKFCRLAKQGNPSVMVLLWLPEYITKHPIGEQLIGIRDHFISREAGQRFLGYLISQKMRLTGERSRNVTRPDLVEKYGYDTKFAMHALRLGYEGIELLTHRTMTIPAPANRREILMAVRTGDIRLDAVLMLIEEAEKKLKGLIDDCTWTVDSKAIDKFLVEAHLDYWG